MNRIEHTFAAKGSYSMKPRRLQFACASTAVLLCNCLAMSGCAQNTESPFGQVPEQDQAQQGTNLHVHNHFNFQNDPEPVFNESPPEGGYGPWPQNGEGGDNSLLGDDAIAHSGVDPDGQLWKTNAGHNYAGNRVTITQTITTGETGAKQAQTTAGEQSTYPVQRVRGAVDVPISVAPYGNASSTGSANAGEGMSEATSTTDQRNRFAQIVESLRKMTPEQLSSIDAILGNMLGASNDDLSRTNNGPPGGGESDAP